MYIKNNIKDYGRLRATVSEVLCGGEQNTHGKVTGRYSIWPQSKQHSLIPSFNPEAAINMLGLDK